MGMGSRKRITVFFSQWPNPYLPPTPLSGQATKKDLYFFAASLSTSQTSVNTQLSTYLVLQISFPVHKRYELQGIESAFSYNSISSSVHIKVCYRPDHLGILSCPTKVSVECVKSTFSYSICCARINYNALEYLVVFSDA